MARDANQPSSNADLERAARLRRERDMQLSMSERLEKLHELCLQVTSIAGVAKPK